MPGVNAAEPPLVLHLMRPSCLAPDSAAVVSVAVVCVLFHVLFMLVRTIIGRKIGCRQGCIAGMVEGKRADRPALGQKHHTVNYSKPIVNFRKTKQIQP